LDEAEARYTPVHNAVPTTDIDMTDWTQVQEVYKQDQVVNLLVTGFNRGGLLVNNDEMQGFVPISHLIGVPVPCQNEERDNILKSYVGCTLRLKVIECDPERGRVVFSERAALADPGMRIEILNGLKVGSCVRGRVTTITDFGVFVDLGGVEGLIHISELSWGRVQHPNDMVSPDQHIEVYVLQLDQERSRVALSIKRLNENPWETANERYSPGQVADAVITSIVSFGAFARLDDGLDGLIHVSEMGEGDEAKTRLDKLTKGQRIKVSILHVDPSRQRMGLSLHTETEA
jgi:small subunit ribosomal protein S1